MKVLSYPTNRREFLKHAGRLGGGSVVVCYLNEPAWAFGRRDKPDSIGKNSWLGADGQPQWRYDGLAKVTGQKIYARDFRAKDLPWWPQQENFAYVLRSPIADKQFLGVDLKSVLAEFSYSKVISSSDLASWGVAAAGPFLMPRLLVGIGDVPDYLGQPVALTIFDSYESFRSAKYKLIDVKPYLRFSNTAHPRERDAYGISRFVRYQDEASGIDFSFVKDGPWAPPWEAPDLGGSANAQASHYIQRIDADIKKQVDLSNWQIFQGDYATQGVDPMFMEPECGLAWYDRQTQVLSLTIGTQSPHDDGVAILNFFRNSKTIKVSRVVINCCYPGGGFGGRDSSDFPLLLAIAAVASPGKTVRMIYSRFDQFQSGIKRHPAQISVSLAVAGNGKFEALKSQLRLDGGGQNNYSFAVQNVGARNASVGYHFSKSVVDSVAMPSIAIPAGSVRGFGSFQASFALECLIDEVAANLGFDPIELRLRNVVTDPQTLHTGVVPVERIHSDIVLKKAQSCKLWTDRQQEKVKRQSKSKRYGVGVALGVKSFGKNPGDACLAALTMDANGNLHVLSNTVDIGNGSATALPLAAADILGKPASKITLGETAAFGVLALETAKPKDQAEQDRLAVNPNWVPSISMSTAASASAFQMRHAVQEAAKALMQLSIVPAAKAVWQLPGRMLDFETAALKWNDGHLTYKDLPPLPLAVIAAKAHAMGLVTGAMVHAFYRSHWVRARFETPAGIYEGDIDAMALRFGTGDFGRFSRQSVSFPSFSTTLAGANRYTPYAVVLAVEVELDSGAVRVDAAETFLECGAIINRQLVEGQMHGAFAMGVGQALLESYPLTLEGPGQGGWNLHRYQVPLAKDCALGRVAFNIVTVDNPGLPKGMAEVVFNPIPAAIANAIADATGKRFRQLPIRPEDIKAAFS